MSKTLESELNAEDRIENLCGFQNISDTLFENYQIKTLGDLVELNLEEVDEEDIKPLVKAFSKFDDGVLSKEDKEYLQYTDNEDMLAYVKETLEYIQAQIYGEEDYQEENYAEEDYEEEEQDYGEEEVDEEGTEELTFKEELADSYDIGSATKLLGSNYIVHVFVEDQESEKWTKKHKDYVLNHVEEGINFIRREARKYGVKGLTFKNGMACGGKTFIYEEVVPAADDESNEDFPRDLLEQALEMPVEESIEEIKESYAMDNVMFMIHVNKSGTSYCQSATVSWANIEYCTLFGITEVDWDEDGELDLEYSSTYAHELLHAYGAWDLYNIDETSNLDEEKIELINTYFANEIMMTQEQDIDSHFIGDITAYQIGWIDEVDEKYEKILN